MTRFQFFTISTLSSAIVLGVGCAKQRTAQGTESSVASQVTVKDDKLVKYSHTKDGELQLDIIKPNPEKDLHLAIILIHGGGWVGGNHSQMTEIGAYLADKGFLCASIDYRLAPKNLWPAQLDDAQTAVRYVRVHAKELGVKADRIGAAGISAGGHLSMLLGTTDTWHDGDFKGVSSRVQAVCSISGIHDLDSPLTVAGEKWRIVQALLGENDKANHAARAKASPDYYLDKKTAPTLFIQGKIDPLVPPEQSTVAAAKLKALSVPTQTILVDGMGHGLSPQNPPEAAALDEMVNWMKKYLAAN